METTADKYRSGAKPFVFETRILNVNNSLYSCILIILVKKPLIPPAPMKKRIFFCRKGKVIHF